MDMSWLEFVQVAAPIGAVMLTYGIVEIVKRAVPDSPNKGWIVPSIAAVIGAISMLYLKGYSPENMVTGMVCGLGASEVYDVLKRKNPEAGGSDE